MSDGIPSIIALWLRTAQQSELDRALEKLEPGDLLRLQERIRAILDGTETEAPKLRTGLEHQVEMRRYELRAKYEQVAELVDEIEHMEPDAVRGAKNAAAVRAAGDAKRGKVKVTPALRAKASELYGIDPDDPDAVRNVTADILRTAVAARRARDHSGGPWWMRITERVAAEYGLSGKTVRARIPDARHIE